MTKKQFLTLLNRLIQLAVLFVFVRFLLSLKWHLVWENIDKFPKAIGLTILLTATGLFFGFLIAVPLALIRETRKPRWLAGFADGYVSVFRGTPLLIQLYLIYFGLGQFEFIRASFLWWVLKDPLLCAILAISLNSGAYACEIFRGSLANVATGQIEAAEALGLSQRQTNWLIWIPSALRLSIPQYGNEMIFTMHGTALAGLVTIGEVFGTSLEINSRYYVTYEGMITAAIIYVCLTVILSFIARWLEKRYLSYILVK